LENVLGFAHGLVGDGNQYLGNRDYDSLVVSGWVRAGLLRARSVVNIHLMRAPDALLAAPTD
jgi:hypothetical protein